jgi:RHS repeat-associated protein
MPQSPVVTGPGLLGMLKCSLWIALFLFPIYPVSGQTSCSLDLEQFSAPSVSPFNGQTIRYGLVTISGGTLAKAAVHSIWDPSTIYLTFMTDANIYGLADDGVDTQAGRVCTNCSVILTISFSQPVSNFSFSLGNGLSAWFPYFDVVVNGTLVRQPFNESMAAPAPLGATAFMSYPFAAGFQPGPQPTSNVQLVTITSPLLPYTENGNTVYLRSNYTNGGWDFFIDGINYTRPDNQACDYVPPPPDPGPCDECEAVAGQPINLYTGDVWTSKTDYSVAGLAGGLSLTRTWNSLWNQNNPPFSAGMFGIGWTSDFEQRLQILDSTHIEYWLGSGNTWMFTQPSGCPTCAYNLAAPANKHGSLTFNSTTNLYTIQFADGTNEIFNSNGYLTSILDRNSNATNVTYDASNRIIKVTAPGGPWLTFSYALAQDPNRVTSIQDSVGTVATYSYFSSLLTQAAYPDGGQLNYAYDTANNINTITDDQAKIIETHTYDGSGRGLTSSRAGGVDAVTVQYSGGSTTLTDSNSNTTAYAYSNIAGRSYITGLQGPGCDSCGGRNNQLFTRDTLGNRLSATDPNGNTVSYTYDGSSNVLTRTDAVGTWTYTYNGFNEVLTAKDPLGNTTTNAYDAKGNLTSITTPSPDGGTTAASKMQFAYDTKGEMTQVTDPLNNSTVSTYYSTGLVNTIKDVQRNLTTFSYDARGNRTSVKDALNNITSFTYDAMNRLKKITYPNSTTTQFGYDLRGRRTSVTDANSKTTAYAYDDADRLTSVIDPTSNLTQYTYDTENNLISITDALTRVTNFSYDNLGRVAKTLFPSNLFEAYAYDNNGNLASRLDRKGNTVLYTYDQLNRLTQKTYPDSTSITYAYDADSRLKQVVDLTGTYAFVYDNMGRLSSSITNYSFLAGRNFTTRYMYDKASNRTGFSDPEAGSTAYVYDSLNRLTTLTPPAAISSGSFGFSYDAISRRISLTRPNSVTTSYSYDNLSHLLSVLHKKKTTTLDGTAYTVDNVGNHMTRTPQPSGIASAYGYDALYELTSTNQGSTTTESYSYDQTGNRLSTVSDSGWIYNSSNELTSRPGIVYTYDSNGNTLTSVAGSNTTTYAWDFENRMSSVTLPGSGGTVSFKYDPFGRRSEKTTSSATSIYAYDSDNLIEETNSSGSVVARYSQGLNIDEPLAMLRSATISYYQADGLGSITSLSTGAGALANTYTYDSYGKTTATGSLVNSLQYTGHEFDTETNLDFYRARYYDPAVGRFLSEDPTGFKAGVNFYPYVTNDPVNQTDPMGFDSDSQFCRRLLEKIENVRKNIQRRIGQLDENPLNLPESCPGPASLSKAGHRMLINMDKALLASLEATYAWRCKDKPPSPPVPVPVPADTTVKAGTAVSVGVIIYYIISEGTRLFPPRNLIPIP